MARGICCAVLLVLFWACSSEDSGPGAGGAGASGDAGEGSGLGGQESMAGSGAEAMAGASAGPLGGSGAEAGASSVTAGQASGGEAELGGAGGAAGELPRFEVLPLPDSSTSSSGVGLSADGSVVVGQTNSAQAQSGFRWTRAEGLRLLEALPTQSNTHASGVSADGQVVIGSSGAELEAVYFPNGGVTPQSLLSAGWESLQAKFVSADGSVIAGTGTLTGGKAGAFRWTEAGGAVSLGDFASTNVSVVGMSADGSKIIGNAGDATTTGYLWDASAQGNQLGQLLPIAGDDLTNVLAISADGSLVVGDSIQTGGTSRRARWTSKTLATLLDPVDPGTPWGCGGGPFSTCTGISRDGSVIYTQRGGIAQVWTEAEGLKALSVLESKFNCVMVPPQAALLGGMAGDCIGPPVAVVWNEQGTVSRLDDVLGSLGVSAPEISGATISMVRAVSATVGTILGDDFGKTVWLARLAQ